MTAAAATKKKVKKTKAPIKDDAPPKKLKKQQSKKQVVEEKPSASESEDEDMKLTLEALDAISDEEDSDDAAENGEEDGGDGEWDDEANALRAMISNGAFDEMLKKHGKKGNTSAKGGGKKSKQQQEESSDEEDGSDEEELEEVELSMEQDDQEDEENGSNKSDDEESSDDEDRAEIKPAANQVNTLEIALKTAIQSTDRNLPWAESFAVVPPTPLPFGSVDDDATTTAAAKKRKLNNTDDDGEEEEEKQTVDIHDDLKREVAFYDNALEAVNIARMECEEAGIPFTRPDDFFAEMVKSDGEYIALGTELLYHLLSSSTIQRLKKHHLSISTTQITWPKSKIVSSSRPKRLKQSNVANLTRNKPSWPKNVMPIVLMKSPRRRRHTCLLWKIGKRAQRVEDVD
jgi:rRNA-processing protein EBP2